MVCSQITKQLFQTRVPLHRHRHRIRVGKAKMGTHLVLAAIARLGAYFAKLGHLLAIDNRRQPNFCPNSRTVAGSACEIDFQPIVAIFGTVVFVEVIGLTGIEAGRHTQVQIAVAIPIPERAAVRPAIIQRRYFGGVFGKGSVSDSTIDFWSYRIMYDVFDCVLASCTALSARMYFRQQAMQQRETQLRAEKSEAELRALKGQLQPHFLFNTINNLYALARIKSNKTAPVALKLAQLLRYVLYESQKPKVPLNQEIQLLRDYVELEKLRFDDGRLTVRLDVDLDNPKTEIAPLLLLPLVENAFKHGASEQRDEARISISIVLKNNVLDAKIENTKPFDKPHTAPGIGLQNLRRQLELLYPKRHELEINENDTDFVVLLHLIF